VHAGCGTISGRGGHAATLNAKYVKMAISLSLLAHTLPATQVQESYVVDVIDSDPPDEFVVFTRESSRDGAVATTPALISVFRRRKRVVIARQGSPTGVDLHLAHEPTCGCVIVGEVLVLSSAAGSLTCISQAAASRGWAVHEVRLAFPVAARHMAAHGVRGHADSLVLFGEPAVPGGGVGGVIAVEVSVSELRAATEASDGGMVATLSTQQWCVVGAEMSACVRAGVSRDWHTLQALTPMP